MKIQSALKAHKCTIEEVKAMNVTDRSNFNMSLLASKARFVPPTNIAPDSNGGYEPQANGAAVSSMNIHMEESQPYVPLPPSTAQTASTMPMPDLSMPDLDVAANEFDTTVDESFSSISWIDRFQGDCNDSDSMPNATDATDAPTSASIFSPPMFQPPQPMSSSSESNFKEQQQGARLGRSVSEPQRQPVVQKQVPPLPPAPALENTNARQQQQIKLQMHLAQLQKMLEQQQQYQYDQAGHPRKATQSRQKQPSLDSSYVTQVKSIKTSDQSSPRGAHREVTSTNTANTVKPTTAIATTSTSGAGPLAQGGMNVLVIEDEPLIRMTAEAFLKYLGHKVDVATTYNEGKERMLRSLHEGPNSARYHIIFADLQLGRDDQPGGLDLARWIRQEEQRVGIKHPTPIIAVTGSTLVEDISGLSGFMVKPYQMEKVCKALNRAIKMHISADKKPEQATPKTYPVYRNPAFTVPKEAMAGTNAKMLTCGPFASGMVTEDTRFTDVTDTVEGEEDRVKREQGDSSAGSLSHGLSPILGSLPVEDEELKLVLECLLPEGADASMSAFIADGLMEGPDLYDVVATEMGAPPLPNGGSASGSGGGGSSSDCEMVSPANYLANSDTSNERNVNGNGIMSDKAEAYEKLENDTEILSILVIEDEPLIRMTAEAFIKHLGHTVQLANDYAEAQTIMREAFQARRPFHIIFTDLELGDDQPGGLDLARWIRQEEQRVGIKHPTPIIAVTGSTLVEDISGLSGFMQKPYQIELLGQAIEKWCPFNAPTTSTAVQTAV
jgi:CheY-like chemotaxis protein